MSATTMAMATTTTTALPLAGLGQHLHGCAGLGVMEG